MHENEAFEYFFVRREGSEKFTPLFFGFGFTLVV
jgi:hypothetical protein